MSKGKYERQYKSHVTDTLQADNKIPSSVLAYESDSLRSMSSYLIAAYFT